MITSTSELEAIIALVQIYNWQQLSFSLSVELGEKTFNTNLVLSLIAFRCP